MHLTYPASIIINPSSKEEAQAFQDLNAYCTHYNKIERKLYVDWIVKKNDINILKQDYQQRYNLNARQFNSMRIELQGKVDSVRTRRSEGRLRRVLRSFVSEINKAALVDSENAIKKLIKTYKYYEGLLAHLIKSPPEDYKTNKIKSVSVSFSISCLQYGKTVNKYKHS